MYTNQKPNPLCASAPSRLCVNSLFAYFAYFALKFQVNQKRHETEPKANQTRTTVDYQASKVNQKRIKSEPNPNQKRTDSEPPARNRPNRPIFRAFGSAKNS